MNETIKTLTEASPPILLAVAINLLLVALKKTPWFPNWTLPLSAMAIGALTYPWLADPTATIAVRSPALYNGVLGASIGGMSVAFHQQVRQFLGLNTGQTEFITKPKDPNHPNLDGQNFTRTTS